MPVGLRTMLGNIACAIKLRKSITVYIRVGSMYMFFFTRVIIILGERGGPVRSTATLPLRCTEKDIIL